MHILYNKLKGLKLVLLQLQLLNVIFADMKLYFSIFIVLLFSGCANMVAPTGGEKDTTPPNCIDRYQHIEINNNKETKLTFVFDERIQEHKFIGNFFTSPTLNEVSHKIKGNTLEIIIKDSISPKLHYEVSLGNCIKDLTEGNVITTFIDEIYTFDEELNLYTLEVFLENFLTHKDEKDHWVLLYKSDTPDSLIFKTTPNYVGKSNIDGYVIFNNIIEESYKIVSLSGDDYIYHDGEIISFTDKEIVAGVDTTIDLYTFNPLQKIDSTEITKDSTITEGGNLIFKSDFSGNIVVQLLQENKVIIQENFKNMSELNFKNIGTGEYTIRAFQDNNENGYWDIGNFAEKKQAEKTYHFHEKITIRSNWDLELEWFTVD